MTHFVCLSKWFDHLCHSSCVFFCLVFCSRCDLSRLVDDGEFDYLIALELIHLMPVTDVLSLS